MTTRYSLLAALALALPPAAFAAQVSLPDLLNPAHVEALRAIRAAIPRWTSVSLRADCWGGSSCRVSEHSQRIDLSGHRTSWGSFSFNGSAAGASLHFSADPTDSRDPRHGYNLWGSQVNLSLRPSGNGYWLTGNLGRRSVSITFNRFGSGWSMHGQSGLNLNLSGFNQSLTASGSVDLEQFGPSELAAFGSVMAVLSSLPPAK